MKAPPSSFPSLPVSSSPINLPLAPPPLAGLPVAYLELRGDVSSSQLTSLCRRGGVDELPGEADEEYRMDFGSGDSEGIEGVASWQPGLMSSTSLRLSLPITFCISARGSSPPASCLSLLKGALVPVARRPNRSSLK